MRDKLRKLRQQETRRVFGLILGGKMLGLLTILGAMKGFGMLFENAAGASTLAQTADQASDLISPLNTVWVLLAAFLVFFMQAGFMALEAGFARSRESVNIMMECVFDTCLCGILYWAVGFAFQFGTGNALIGHSNFFLHGATPAYGSTGVAFLAFFLFQFAFADTASTITSGAMVGRTSFKGDILYSACVSGLIFPIFGHWVWGPGGWLGNTMGWFHGLAGGTVFRDFAGSTVVHTVGGTIALAGCIALGPRLGRKFKRDGGGPTAPHDLNIAAIGAVILWFGWYGFNPGSTLSAMDWEGIGRVAANTTLAACAGGLVAVFFVYPRSKRWDLGMSLNGFLGGLVAVTAPCYWISPGGAVIIGGIAGIVVPLAVDFMEHRRWDDPAQRHRPREPPVARIAAKELVCALAADGDRHVLPGKSGDRVQGNEGRIGYGLIQVRKYPRQAIADVVLRHDSLSVVGSQHIGDIPGPLGFRNGTNVVADGERTHGLRRSPCGERRHEGRIQPSGEQHADRHVSDQSLAHRAVERI